MMKDSPSLTEIPGALTYTEAIKGFFENKMAFEINDLNEFNCLCIVISDRFSQHRRVKVYLINMIVKLQGHPYTIYLWVNS